MILEYANLSEILYYTGRIGKFVYSRFRYWNGFERWITSSSKQKTNPSRTQAFKLWGFFFRFSFRCTLSLYPLILSNVWWSFVIMRRNYFRLMANCDFNILYGFMDFKWFVPIRCSLPPNISVCTLMPTFEGSCVVLYLKSLKSVLQGDNRWLDLGFHRCLCRLIL